MTIKTESRKLMCQLTEDELLRRGDEMAKTYMQVAALDLEKKRISAKIKPLDERIEALVVIIDTKEEERDTERRWVFDWALGVKRLYREDTGLELDFREIRAHERQQQLELETSRPDDGLALGAEEPQPDEDNVCLNTGCLQYEVDEPNHCRSLEYTSQCDNPQGTGAPGTETTGPRAIYLPDAFFAKDGKLAKAFKGMAGIPDDGKARNVFEHGFLYLLHGSLSSGIEGNIEFYAYKMIGRGAYGGPVDTIAERGEKYRAQLGKCGALSNVGCIVEFDRNEWVLAEAITFKREETENARPETETAAEGGETSNEVAGSVAGGGAAAQVDGICSKCKSAHPNCQDCCNSCAKNQLCTDAQFCTLTNQDTICSVCVGLCCDYTPGTAVTECPGFASEITEAEDARRSDICAGWEECRHKAPANEDAGECLDDVKPGYLAQVKANRASGMGLQEAVNAAAANSAPAEKEFACKVCGFDGGTKVYLSRHVEREHNMTASQYKKAFPANQTALQLAREKRAKLIKGAK